MTSFRRVSTTVGFANWHIVAAFLDTRNQQLRVRCISAFRPFPRGRFEVQTECWQESRDQVELHSSLREVFRGSFAASIQELEAALLSRGSRPDF